MYMYIYIVYYIYIYIVYCILYILYIVFLYTEILTYKKLLKAVNKFLYDKQ